MRPLSPEHPDDETFPGLLILRPEGRIFFFNAGPLGERMLALAEEHQPRVVLLDLSRVPDIEYSALQALIEGERRSRERGFALWLAGLNPGVLEMVRNACLADRLGPDQLLFNARLAIQRYQALPPAAASVAGPGVGG